MNKKRDIKNKVCICTLGKEENRYIREFIKHYKNYGVDKIYLYDNNDIYGERFESVINDFIEEGYVNIINWRGKKKVIYNIMNECYYDNNKNYDWIIFYELDEFVHLYNYTNIKNFLNEKKFKNCQIIYLNLLVHTDNEQLYYEDKSLFQRFPIIQSKNKNDMLQVKMIIKGGLNNIQITTTAMTNSNNNLHACNGFGDRIKQNGFYTNITDYDFFYIDHFFCKSTEEFINKLVKGDALQTGVALEDYKILRIERYFLINNYTKEKFHMIEKGLKLNRTKLEKLKKKILKNVLKINLNFL